MIRPLFLAAVGMAACAVGTAAEPLVGYTELRTNLPGGRHAKVRTMRAAVVRADGTGKRFAAHRGDFQAVRHGPRRQEQAGWVGEGRRLRLRRSRFIGRQVDLLPRELPDHRVGCGREEQEAHRNGPRVRLRAIVVARRQVVALRQRRALRLPSAHRAPGRHGPEDARRPQRLPGRHRVPRRARLPRRQQRHTIVVGRRPVGVLHRRRRRVGGTPPNGARRPIDPADDLGRRLAPRPPDAFAGRRVPGVRRQA